MREERLYSVLIHYSYTTNKKKCPFSLVAGARASLPALLHLPPFEAARPARTNALKRPLQARLQALRPCLLSQRLLSVMGSDFGIPDFKVRMHETEKSYNLGKDVESI